MKLSLTARAYLRAVAAALAAGAAAHETIVRVENGFLKGAVDAATVRFQGVPYATPPVGSLRWASKACGVLERHA
jgi:hypothetical protein